MSLADPPSHLGSLIRCTRALIDEEPQLRSITPLTVFIPPTTTTMMINAESTKQLPSPTNSSTRSTVVRSQSSSDVDSPNEAPIPPVTSEESAEKTDGADEVRSISQEPSPADRGNSANHKEVSPKEGLSHEHLSIENCTRHECRLTREDALDSLLRPSHRIRTRPPSITEN